MTAFKAILRWEIRTALQRTGTWVYFVLAAMLAFFPMLVLSGAWDLGLGSTRTLANSPLALTGLISAYSVLLMPITAAIAGNALYRDYDAGVEQLLYSTPVRKSEFLGGRFAGALAVNLMILLGLALGALLASLSPWVKPERMAPFELMAYVAPYLTFVIPNLVLAAAIFFALVALTRQMMPVYVGGILLLLVYGVSATLMADLDNKRLAALLDPFGFGAQGLITQYWSIAEQNTQYVPLEGVLLANRLIWLAVGLAIFAFAYRRFRFAYDVGDTRSTVAPAAPPADALPAVDFLARVRPAELPAVARRFGPSARVTQFRAIFARSFWRIVWNRYFAIIAAAGLTFLGVAAWQAGRMFATPVWPVTYHMSDVLLETVGFFSIVVIAVYAGELVWAERDVKSHQIVDTTTVPNWVLFLGKLAALCAMLVVWMLLMIVAGVAMQAIKGYFRFEIPLYLQTMFGRYFPDLVLLAVLAMAVHVFVNHKYLGHLVVILTFIGMGLLSLVGLERGLYLYSYDTGLTYSDMNGWGPFVVPFIWWKLYWLAFATLLLVATALFWIRGQEQGFLVRARLARRRFAGPARTVAAAAGLAFAGIGSFIYYNTDHLNVYRTSREERRLAAEREKRYKKFESAPQPRVTAVSVRIDLRPKDQDMVIAGRYVLRNKTALPIDTVHLGVREEMSIRSLTFDGGGQRVLADSVRNHHMFRLARPLLPGDSTVMRFEVALETRGFPNGGVTTAIVENGTFVSSGYLPTVGYSDAWELSDEDARKKEKLPPKERMRPPTDSTVRANSYVSSDADWIRFDATVTTEPDQTALAPGYLEREWVQDGRRHFRYTMDVPILNFWAVLSGRYAVKRDRWVPGRDTAGAVDIAVYYHPRHTYNVDRMISAVKKSLDYFTEQFGPYQHRQVRIVEFPRYASFAQSLPNLIPYSEAIGFIARVRDADDIDYPFYVTAHEVAHAWWGHQVSGADAQGATMLSETLSSYSGLMVMEKEFGPRNMRRFLAYKLDNYLAGRTGESRREMPLQLVENQPYIHYYKGAIIMYALRDYIGEERVNATLRRFLDAWKFRGPPYPTSLDLVTALREATPDSLRYLVRDFFETITFFDLKTDSATYREAPGQPGKYQVDLWVHARKERADTLGKVSEIAMRDWIDIGVYAEPPRGSKPQDKNGIPLHLAKQRVDSGKQRVTIVVDQKPYRAGIDPLHKLIDRLSMDNVTGVRDRTARRTAPRADSARTRAAP